jgi:hypothetical protein
VRHKGTSPVPDWARRARPRRFGRSRRLQSVWTQWRGSQRMLSTAHRSNGRFYDHQCPANGLLTKYLSHVSQALQGLHAREAVLRLCLVQARAGTVAKLLP